MLYRIEDGKIRTQALEFSAADHCNLRCAGCSHMSPFIQPRMPAEAELERDMGRLATVLFAGEIRILGGEPLLNPRIIPILKSAKQSGVAAKVVLTTNGLLLHTMPKEFWENVDELRISLYPEARPTERVMQQARERAAESGTELRLCEYHTFRITTVTEPHPNDGVTRKIFQTCRNAHQHHCHMVHRGWYYKCQCPAYLPEYLAGIGKPGYQPHPDGFDIHQASDLREELWKFLTDDTPLDACRYCLGHLGKRQVHHQLSKDEVRDPNAHSVTRRTHLSWPLLAKASIKYTFRRASEAVTGKGRW